MATKNKFNLPKEFKKLIPLFDTLNEDFPYNVKLKNPTVIFYPGKCILIISNNKKNLIFINQHSECSISGKIANRFNVFLWPFLKSLRMAFPKLIEEINLLEKWVDKEAAEIKRLNKIVTLIADAKDLGLKVYED